MSRVIVKTVGWRRWPAATRAKVLAKSGGRCWYCGKPVTSRSMHVDHFVATCNGGKDALRNLVPACVRCNLAKGGRDVASFRARERLRKNKIPPFSEQQRRWLTRHGWPDPHLTGDPVEFHYERAGLKR